MTYIRQLRAKAIEQCVFIAAKHFDTTPVDVMFGRTKKASPAHRARQAVWAHLHASGMSYKAIGKIWGKSDSPIRVGVRRGRLSAPESLLLLSKQFPEIPGTINFHYVTEQ